MFPAVILKKHYKSFVKDSLLHLKIFAVILAGSSTAVNASHPAAVKQAHFLPEVTKE